MSNNKGDKDMQTQAVTETITDMSAVLSLKQVHNYTDQLVERGHAEYNNQRILVRSQHPLDQCLKRCIIEQEHHDIGKRLRNYRDCAVSKLSGRTYNATGEGDSEMDAATVYANLMRSMLTTSGKKRSWELVVLICFAEPNMDGRYFSEADYGVLYSLAPNIRHALENVDEEICQVRKK
jgi:hypothetical protein